MASRRKNSRLEVNQDLVNNWDSEGIFNHPLEDSDHEDLVEEQELDEDVDEELCLEDQNVQEPVYDLLTQEIKSWSSSNGTEWTATLPPHSRTRVHNIVSESPGVRGVSIGMTKMDLFNLFITENIKKIVCDRTNNFVRESLLGNCSSWKELIPTELDALCGLLLLSGADRQQYHRAGDFWSMDAFGRPHYPATMGRDRFLSLMGSIRFDDVFSRRSRVASSKVSGQLYDKLCPIREVWDDFTAQLPKYYRPGSHICIDEQMIPTRAKCPFRVYMKNKPDKYGVKNWAAVDCESRYILQLQMYLGKEGHSPEVNQGRRVILDLVEPYFGSGRGVTGDNFFTSFDLAKVLLEKNLTYVGTINRNRKWLPRELTLVKGREALSSEFSFNGDMTIVFYVAKNASGKKAVCLLSTEHHDRAVDSKTPFKPEIIHHYNSTKGAVDTVDQMLSTYSCRRTTRRFPMLIFMHMVDVAALQAYILWQQLYPELKTNFQQRQTFLRNLAEELIWAQIQNRMKMVPLPHATKEALQTLAKFNIKYKLPSKPAPPPEQVKGYCACGINSRKACTGCQNFVCKGHATVSVLCQVCLDKIDEEVVDSD